MANDISQRLLADAEKLCRSVRERMVEVTPQQKKEFLRLVVERIWVDENNSLDIEVVISKLEKQPNDVICETPLSKIWIYIPCMRGDGLYERGFASLKLSP